MEKVVFICRGNIFRSQIAKALYNKMAKDGSFAESYGVAVEAEGREGDLLSGDKILAEFPGFITYFEVMKNIGMDISSEHCLQIRPEFLKDAKKIIMMAEKDFIPDWLNEYKYEYWEIPNPSNVTAKITEDVIALLKEKILKII